MRLTVITMTRGDRPVWLAECLQSVLHTIPKDARHLVHVGGHDFQVDRWNAARGTDSEYIAWVDDDDMVLPGALQACMDALDATGAGAAFTAEDQLDANGRRIRLPIRRVNTRDIAMTPQAMHHLSMVRVSALHPDTMAHADRIGIGIDWLMRAGAALTRGAVQVPMTGYLWRRHDAQESSRTAWETAYQQAMPALREVTTLWGGGVGRSIPLWKGNA